jgi:hypothetical protein
MILPFSIAFSIAFNLVQVATPCVAIKHQREISADYYKWEDAVPLQYIFLQDIYQLKNKTRPSGTTAAVVYLNDENSEEAAIVFYISGPIACSFSSLSKEEYLHFKSIK